MSQDFSVRTRRRRMFGRIPAVITMPNLIEVQRNSYDQFLQADASTAQRELSGLQGVFKSVFPMKDFAGRAELHFVRYELEAPKYDVEECQQRGMTFASPLKVTLQLWIFDVDEEIKKREVRDIKEQDVYMGDMPLMTDKGTFIVNGTERVIVSQMHRSPGAFFDHDRGKTHSSGKFLYAARIIPYRGSWLDFEFDAKDIVHVRIDRRRKLPASTLFYALGMSMEQMLRYFYRSIVATQTKDGGWRAPFEPETLIGIKLGRDLINAKTGKAVLEAGTKVTRLVVRKLAEAKMTEQLLADEDLIGRYMAVDIIDESSGEVLVEAGDEITAATLDALKANRMTTITLLDINTQTVGAYMRNTLVVDKCRDRHDALLEIYKVMRPGEPPTEEAAERLLYDLLLAPVTLVGDKAQVLSAPKDGAKVVANLARAQVDGNAWLLEIKDGCCCIAVSQSTTSPAFSSGVWVRSDQIVVQMSERYDLSSVGRVKMNARLGLGLDEGLRALTRTDLLAVVKTLVEVKDGKGEIDDIDHLGNRRVRSVGELLENQYRMGLMRMERAIRERMSLVELDSIMPHDLINAKPAAAAVREFFGSSQLSQFMDQTNPLSEITHKRRLSALGPGGLTRERAGFEVRDVHPTHYGRICPIETPEGPNIGLISSLATYARVNKHGFIESPYRRAVNGKVAEEVVFLTAMEEGRYTIAQANAELDKAGKFAEDLVSCRRGGEFVLAVPKSIDFIDVSPKQLVSVAAALIPFLENDDANRALMGSNMQRQAVPLTRTQAPLVGTGMEAVVARDSGTIIVARRGGVVDQVDATRIVVRATHTGGSTVGVDIYKLLKFRRSNQNTCINQRPLVRVGEVVAAGDILGDGPSTHDGELALGYNVLCAFMPWNGYNFEDSILISERLVKDDIFTSIHIEEFEVSARDTKLGQEEITRDIPNVGEETLKNLDEAGIVYIGAEVKAGDILVGKITPKGESPMTPEEKLLRSIFGEKASDVRDTSLKVPPGVSGTIVEVRVFSRRGVDKDERALAIERDEIERLAKDRDDERAILERNVYDRLRTHLMNRTIVKGPKALKAGGRVTQAVLEELSLGQWWQIAIKDHKVTAEIEELKRQRDEDVQRLQRRFEDKVEKLRAGDDLPPGVLKMVKVFIAVKRKLQAGDKMAGRHGNKGVISRIVAVEDMPYLEDGTPVDVVLNPLGVPSRMNVGQILETHLGWAAAGIGRQIGAMMDAARSDPRRLKDLRQFLGTTYGDRKAPDLTDEELVREGERLRGGVPMGTPVFDGARESDIVGMLENAGVDVSGQVTLVDGRTGLPFDRKVTVGYLYMLKLHHLVDDKIHARSIGPYSLVTQQPLGGKAQFGGQRFGEMEVWALQAYGAAYTLQEMLTVKSDDVSGRTKVYEAIVRGEDTFEAGIPESFNVLVKEMQSLCLNVDLRQRS
ncbi:MAG: DNA-directed RNA polymerase subunit beta [Alphaproteobacteria bacterium]|nr:DNA-directed RNA polymerase subunit beta [Alphaproteobacteria bacterium]